jgi:hypothetical protein
MDTTEISEKQLNRSFFIQSEAICLVVTRFDILASVEATIIFIFRLFDVKKMKLCLLSVLSVVAESSV